MKQALKAIYIDIHHFATLEELSRLCKQLRERKTVFTFSQQDRLFALLKALEDNHYQHCKLYIVSRYPHSQQTELLRKVINNNIETALGSQYKTLSIEVECLAQNNTLGVTHVEHFTHLASAHSNKFHKEENIIYIPPERQHDALATQSIYHRCASLRGCMYVLTRFSQSIVIEALNQIIPTAPPRSGSPYRLTGQIIATGPKHPRLKRAVTPQPASDDSIRRAAQKTMQALQTSPPTLLASTEQSERMVKLMKRARFRLRRAQEAERQSSIAGSNAANFFKCTKTLTSRDLSQEPQIRNCRNQRQNQQQTGQRP